MWLMAHLASLKKEEKQFTGKKFQKEERLMWQNEAFLKFCSATSDVLFLTSDIA